jgi:hypothetical protein
VAIISLLLYPFGILLWLAILCYRIRHSLDQLSTQISWGSLYLNYNTQFYWWELIHMVRRLASVMGGSLLSTEVTAQLVILMMINYVSMIVHLSARPYKLAADNRFQIMTDMIAFFACFGGLLYFTASLAVTASSTLTTFYFIVFAAVAILILLFIIYKVRNVVVRILRKRAAAAAAAAAGDDSPPSGSDGKGDAPGKPPSPSRLAQLAARFRSMFGSKDDAFSSDVALAPIGAVTVNQAYRAPRPVVAVPDSPGDRPARSNPLFGQLQRSSSRSPLLAPPSPRTPDTPTAVSNPIRRAMRSPTLPMPVVSMEPRRSDNPLFRSPAPPRAPPTAAAAAAAAQRSNPLFRTRSPTRDGITDDRL